MTAEDNQTISFHTVAIIGTVLAVTTGGAIWLGQLSNQILVNTRRLDSIEEQLVRIHENNVHVRTKVEELQRSISPASPAR